MSKKLPYLVKVKTSAGVHVQVRAGNNRIVWTTEVYKNPRNADRAIALLDHMEYDVREETKP